MIILLNCDPPHQCRANFRFRFCNHSCYKSYPLLLSLYNFYQNLMRFQTVWVSQIKWIYVKSVVVHNFLFHQSLFKTVEMLWTYHFFFLHYMSNSIYNTVLYYYNTVAHGCQKRKLSQQISSLMSISNNREKI